MERWGGHTRLHNKTLGNQFQNTFFLKFFRDRFIGGKHGGGVEILFRNNDRDADDVPLPARWYAQKRYDAGGFSLFFLRFSDKINIFSELSRILFFGVT